MKQSNITQATLSHKISYYHLLVFVAALPFDFFYSELVLISFLIHTFLHFRQQHLRYVDKSKILIVSSVYLLTLFCTIYSNDQSEAFSEWMKQLSLLLFPLLLFINPIPIRKYRESLLYGFTLTCTLTILYLYADAFRTIFYYHLGISTLFTQGFMNHSFSEPIHLHATYLSIYTCFAVIFLIDKIINARMNKGRLLKLLCLLILSAGLLQLASRMILIFLLTYIILIAPLYYFTGFRRIRFILCSLLLLTCVLFTFSHFKAFEERYITDLKEDISLHAPIEHINDSRAQRWSIAFELIAQSPVAGYGSGSEKRLLREAYFQHQLYDSYLHQLNAHNQYLSFLIKSGILGLIVFLISLLTGLRYAILQKDILFIAFMVMIVMVCFTENILDVNKGIFFYGFFYSLFLSYHYKNTVKQVASKQPVKAQQRIYKIIHYQ